MTIELNKIDEYRWELPMSYKKGMNVPGIIFADSNMISMIRKDDSLNQVANGAFLPGILKACMAMPDIHEGYGLPIGGVVATEYEKGVISPGGTGYDINCGVRLITTNIVESDIKTKEKRLAEALFSNIPVGVGSKGKIVLSDKDEKEVLIKGSRWAVENGYGNAEDVEYTEANGMLEGASYDAVSKRAMERGRKQLGTLGSGNHFIEIQKIDEIYNQQVADTFGLFNNQITIMIHSGSRGLGHQVCTDYLEIMLRAMKRYDIRLPDIQLACTPINSKEGRDYLSAMKAAANFAWANRQCLMAWSIEVLMKLLNISPNTLGAKLLYDVAHNIVKVETHTIEGKQVKAAVHRKGATRAFPAEHPEVPSAYRHVGQPVIIPGDMGRYSYILVGTKKAMEDTFGSTCHGAGRVMSRHAAIANAKGRAINRELEDKGIFVKAISDNSIKEEMPDAYKDVSLVVNICHNAGISEKVARLKPIAVIKG